MQHRPRLRALVATGALLGGGLAALASAAPADAATTAIYVHGHRVLSVFGDRTDNRIVVSRDTAGDILVNGGYVDIRGATATVDDVDLLRVFGRAGNDSIALDETNGPLPKAQLFGGRGDDHVSGGAEDDLLAGGTGNDVLTGGRGNESLVGGTGDDFVDGNQGTDTALLGDGNDVFQWDPGDGSDVVEGQAGTDAMVFNGAAAAERFTVAANGSRVQFTRDLGNITMDLAGVERIDTNTLGGRDSFTAQDLTGTDTTELRIDEAGPNGTPDGVADRITIDGTAAADTIAVSGSAASVAVAGLPEAVRLTGTDAIDGLDVEAGAGDDVVTAGRLDAGAVTFSADGGEGNDLLVGSAGDDVLHGGAGDDVLEGGPGNDSLDGGTGNNVLVQ